MVLTETPDYSDRILTLKPAAILQNASTEMYNPVNWIACMPRKTNSIKQKLLKLSKMTNTILLSIKSWFEWSHTLLHPSNTEILASL